MGSVSATEFKAKCLGLLDQVGARQIQQLEITKRGKVVAVLMLPTARAAETDGLHGFLRGSVVVPDGVVPTAPALGEALTLRRMYCVSYRLGAEAASGPRAVI